MENMFGEFEKEYGKTNAALEDLKSKKFEVRSSINERHELLKRKLEEINNDFESLDSSISNSLKEIDAILNDLN